MPDIYLAVPYEQKDAVKELGGKWDPQKKLWRVPSEMELEPFGKWLPLGQMMIAPIWLKKSTQICWKCHEKTIVFALSCARLIDVYDEDEQRYVEDYLDAQISVSDLSEVDISIERFLRLNAHGYWLDYSVTQGCSVWMNHCNHCEAKQGDFYLHSEPGGAFLPMSDEEEAKIVYKEIVDSGQFSVSGSTNVSG